MGGELRSTELRVPLNAAWRGRFHLSLQGGRIAKQPGELGPMRAAPHRNPLPRRGEGRAEPAARLYIHLIRGAGFFAIGTRGAIRYSLFTIRYSLVRKCIQSGSRSFFFKNLSHSCAGMP